MNTIEVALGIGLVAGIIDTVPMIIQKMDKPVFPRWGTGGFGVHFVLNC